MRTVVHLHGGHTPPDSDGYPDAWYLPGQFGDYDYPNTQQATTLWYHDHTFGITRLNIFAGLAGIYLVRDAVEDQLNLPSGPYEIPLIIQDRSFKPDGSLLYPDKGITHPVWVPEFFGDTAVVNGTVWPFLDVEPRQYRLRIVNGSNARFYRLALRGDLPFHQIASDGGFLPAPVTLNQILLAPAERADVIIDFTGLVGQQITLTNDAPAPFPEGEESVPKIPEILQFRVVLPLSGTTDGPLPATLNPVPRIPESDAVRVRDLTLEEEVDAHDEPVILRLNGALFEDPITETPELGTTEIWRLINLTGDTHPIHPHQVQFQILDRTPFDADRYLQDREHGQLGSLESYFMGVAVPPEPQEAGWKDVVRANPKEVTRFIAHFDIAGKYVWHCHILEHEDNDMMRPYEVVASGPGPTTSQR